MESLELPEKDELWYKDVIIYELHIRSFYDSNNDGIGDLPGLIQQLDYLQFLGVNLIWLLPFFPSPLKDDGYDIANYTEVNTSYGSLKDFKTLLHEAHKREMGVMIELVLNHTSNQHEWFERARHAKKDSSLRNYYIWSDTTEIFQDARIIFKDFESSNWSWDPVAKAYYWHRFYSHQPDLNYRNPDVQKAILKIVDFWLKMGVDALRLDAVPYLFEREGTNCENLPETHEFLVKLRKYIDKHYKNRFLLAEANQWPEDSAAYFNQGNACHMAFHFPLMPRMYTAIEMEDRFPLIDILQQTPDIPTNCQWAIFLRNHDELTLEMVTDEERDYLYRIYADDPQMRINLGIRRRLSPLMKGDRRKIELMHALLFMLPGTPVIYYGDEIGMGDNIYLGDRNGVRTPMQWSNDLNAGFSKATPQKLYLPVVIDPDYSYASVNVELEKANDQSLLWWMRRMIALRKRYLAFSRGEIKFLYPDNNKILMFIREYQDQKILVTLNLSRYSQSALIDLSAYKNSKLTEIMGDSEFPKITEAPYHLSFQPYSYFCFEIQESVEENIPVQTNHPVPTVKVIKHWQELLTNKNNKLIEILKNYLPTCDWYPAKGEKIYQLTVSHDLLFKKNKQSVYLLLNEITYKEKKTIYFLLLTAVSEEETKKAFDNKANPVIAKCINQHNEVEFLVDGLMMPFVCQQLFKMTMKKRIQPYNQAEVKFLPSKILKNIIHSKIDLNDIKPIKGAQSNTSIIFNDMAILKFFRKNDFGINPDVEISRFLTDVAKFNYAPRLAATIEVGVNRKNMTLAIIGEYLPNQGTAWDYTIDNIKIFLEQAQTQPLPPHETLKLFPADMEILIGPYASSVQLLAERTAELHLALAADERDDAFKPEHFTFFDQRSLQLSINSLTKKLFAILAKQNKNLDESLHREIQQILPLESVIYAITKEITGKHFSGSKLRCHGDYHLGQVLYTGKDFIIIDFEGEPDRALSERRIKRSPLKDIAGMLRSFHYAISTVLFNQVELFPTEKNKLIDWGNYWYFTVRKLFYDNYLKVISQHQLLPEAPENIAFLLKLFMLEKVLYEIDYELNHRPTWLKIPCWGLNELLTREI